VSVKASDKESNASSSYVIATEKTSWLGKLNETISEWCSSILVKETRQALKSKQFLWTYFLLLVCVALWTIIGIAFGDLNYGENNAGQDLLMGFSVILGFPLGIIIPFSAYRSLAREYEDGTIHLISITTMKPHQIIIGKFGSAILQMLVYLSVLAPCILFTYLLRGVSLSQIFLGLMICVGASICLTILGLFLAGAIRSRMFGVGVSVLFSIFLGWLYYCWCWLCGELIGSPFPGFAEPEVAVATFGIVSFFGSMAILLLVTAASQISFPSDNRSTKIRVTMLFQQVLFLAFIVALTQSVPYQADMYLVMSLFAGHFWLAMGFLMIGESGKSSRRVQRSLPKSYLGRSLFSFLMPGPGRGFLFALTMMFACSAALILGVVLQDYLLMSPDQTQNVTMGGRWTTVRITNSCIGMAMNCFYVSLYLSLVFLVARFVLRRRTEMPTGTGPLVSLIIGVVIVVVPMLASWILHFNLTRNYSSSYTAPLVVHWYWTVMEVADGSGFYAQTGWFFLFAMGGLAVIVSAMLVACRELLQRPIPVPQRVLIDKKKPEKRALPAGESIDEIFGEIR
jgi:ABC-type transport system involved in cytochrome c biogenesis permease component